MKNENTQHLKYYSKIPPLSMSLTETPSGKRIKISAEAMAEVRAPVAEMAVCRIYRVRRTGRDIECYTKRRVGQELQWLVELPHALTVAEVDAVLSKERQFRGVSVIRDVKILDLEVFKSNGPTVVVDGVHTLVEDRVMAPAAAAARLMVVPQLGLPKLGIGTVFPKVTVDDLVRQTWAFPPPKGGMLAQYPSLMQMVSRAAATAAATAAAAVPSFLFDLKRDPIVVCSRYAVPGLPTQVVFDSFQELHLSLGTFGIKIKPEHVRKIMEGGTMYHEIFFLCLANPKPAPAGSTASAEWATYDPRYHTLPAFLTKHGVAWAAAGTETLSLRVSEGIFMAPQTQIKYCRHDGFFTSSSLTALLQKKFKTENRKVFALEFLKVQFPRHAPQ